MYVCLCKEITEKQVTEKIATGITSLVALQQELGAGIVCGQCCDYMQEMLDTQTLKKTTP